jgi:hypothetical protein
MREVQRCRTSPGQNRHDTTAGVAAVDGRTGRVGVFEEGREQGLRHVRRDVLDLLAVRVHDGRQRVQHRVALRLLCVVCTWARVRRVNVLQRWE